MDRFNFIFPNFVRIAWTSDQVREIWATKIQRCISAWAEIELITAETADRQCAMVTLESEAVSEMINLWHLKGLFARELKKNHLLENHLSTGNAAVPPDSAQRFAVGKDDNTVSQLCDAWYLQNINEIGRLLGYPKCCINSYKDFCVEQSYFDPTWPIAVEAANVTSNQSLIEIQAPIETNMFWRSVGVRCVPHLPCRFDCAASITLGQHYLNAAMQLGFANEVTWLRQILSWPVEWSSLHGIAEIKTPILKICTKTDSSRQKLVVRWTGQDYPDEGARGVAFPYQMPKRTLTESPGFQRGLINLTR
jgi:hypothetical protein